MTDDLSSGLEALLRGELTSLLLRGGRVCEPPSTTPAIFPGAFNPLHAGHRRMADLAAAELSTEVTFELSIVNVDKPPLSSQTVVERLQQFSAEQSVWLTRAATFAAKSRLFGATTFIVGVDTVVRIADPRYYDDDPAERDRAIAELAAAGCRFLVFGRALGQRFQTLTELTLPAELQSICQGVSEDVFRHDISSTDLRP